MKPIAEVALVQAADRAAAQAGIPVAVLMGRAGAAVAAAGRELAGGVSGRRVVALAGKGHNGGDALEALARLARRGAGAEALLTHAPEELGEEERRCVRLVEAAGGRVRLFDPELAGRLLDGADLAIDGLLGTGASGAPRGAAAAAIRAIGAARTPVVAVDIPSGVDGASGAVAGEAVDADVTVTFQAAKPGHLQPPGSGRVGRLVVADIGLPIGDSPWGVSEAADLVGLVPVPHGELHKRSRGVLLAIGGSSGMAGAPTLMGMAARRAGAGLLVLAVPASVASRVGAAVPEALTVALPEADGGITPDAVDACARWLDEASALALGPGLGRSAATGEAVRDLLGRYPGPAVVDADGLFALGHGGGSGGLKGEAGTRAAGPSGSPPANQGLLAGRKGATLLTPHEGEFARLAPDAEGTRLHRAADRAAAWGATVLLKGNNTVIAEPDGRVAVNPTGVPVLASGGTGDVLTGLTGALLAQGLSAFDAARLGAWVHGRAGALATGDLSPLSVGAGDVAGHLPAAFVELLATTRSRSAGGLPLRSLSPPDPRSAGRLPLGSRWPPAAWVVASLLSPPDPR
jgi:NAD(P)H-hydrate epimerase